MRWPGDGFIRVRLIPLRVVTWARSWHGGKSAIVWSPTQSLRHDYHLTRRRLDALLRYDVSPGPRDGDHEKAVFDLRARAMIP